jgi:hypothetical protein
MTLSGPDEMQGADDDEMAVAVVEHALELRHPRIVPVRHELLVEPREVAEVFEQLRAQALELTGAPRRDHLSKHRDSVVELVERLLEHGLLLLGRQRVEQADLKLERLEADDRFAFSARSNRPRTARRRDPVGSRACACRGRAP